MNFYRDRKMAKLTVASYVKSCSESGVIPSFNGLRRVIAQKYGFGERLTRSLLFEIGLKVENEVIVQDVTE